MTFSNLKIFLLMVFMAFGLAGCERLAWKDAQKRGNIPGYKDYLEKYPQGEYATAAWLNIEELTYRRARLQKSPELMWQYLKEFPGGHFVEKARYYIRVLYSPKTNRLTPEQMAAIRVVVETDMGNFTIRLFPEVAPEHCRNLIFLALIGFYRGIAIHRVHKDLVVVMGDPIGDGSGGPGYMLKAEFNDRKHVRGTVSMFRLKMNPDTAGSQFMVLLKDIPEFDGQYTVFGEVTDGLEVVDLISEVEVTGPESHPRPQKPVYIKDMKVQGWEIDWEEGNDFSGD